MAAYGSRLRRDGSARVGLGAGELSLQAVGEALDELGRDGLRHPARLRDRAGEREIRADRDARAAVARGERRLDRGAPAAAAAELAGVRCERRPERLLVRLLAPHLRVERERD